MKFSAVLFAASLVAAVVALPQESKTSSSAIPTPSSSYPPEVASCLDGCALTDVVCQADCFGSPAPTKEDIENTTKCVAACPQGDGSTADSEKYKACQSACIDSKFSPSPSDGDNASGTDSSPAPTGSDGADDEDESGSGSGKDSETSTSATDGAPAPTNASGAASGLTVGGPLAGLFAVVAAFLTL
jgi:hypothetical protein